MLIEFTAAASRTPIAIETETIGEVKDLSGRASWNFELYGRTLITHRASRRVKWAVAEDYQTVMQRIRSAAPAVTSTCKAGPASGQNPPAQR